MSSIPAAASPLDVDDLVAEILLRLPPQPSSLPRVSSVCQRWRLLVSDPRFLRRFRIHHRRNPPLLGFFVENILPCLDLFFEPTLDSPNRAPVRRFPSQPEVGGYFRILNCRHGLLLIILRKNKEILVWDPVIGYQHRIAVLPGFEMVATAQMNGAMLRAAGDVYHFQVVLIGTYREQQHTRVVARVYSSETGLWSNVISMTLSSETDICRSMGCVLVGNSLYWLLSERKELLSQKSACILEFDLDKQSLTMIHVPVDIYAKGNGRFTVMRAEGGGLGFLFLSGYDAQLWNRKKDSDGVVSWARRRTIELGKLLSLIPEKDIVSPTIKGFAEHNNVLFLCTDDGIFMVQLESMQFKRLSETNFMTVYHPFESVYTAETCTGDKHDGRGLLHNT